MGKAEQTMREALGDFLGILEMKARNGAMTSEDVGVMFEAIRSAGGIKATVKDLSEYYHQSEDSVRHVIHRNLMPPPKRRVYYDFASFRRSVPARWTKKRSESGD